MTVIANTVAMPHRGKAAMVQNRARQLAGIYARHGATSRVASVVAGPLTGCVVVSRSYPDFRSAAKAFQSITHDPANIEIWREIDANPGADVLIARDLTRTVHGELKWSTHPISHMRVYEIERDKLNDALKLMPDVTKLMTKAGVNVVAITPVTGENMNTLTISYQCRSIDHWGEVIDTVGTSADFQAIVAKAAKFGTLRTGFAIMSI